MGCFYNPNQHNLLFKDYKSCVPINVCELSETIEITHILK